MLNKNTVSSWWCPSCVTGYLKQQDALVSAPTLLGWVGGMWLVMSYRSSLYSLVLFWNLKQNNYFADMFEVKYSHAVPHFLVLNYKRSLFLQLGDLFTKSCRYPMSTTIQATFSRCSRPISIASHSKREHLIYPFTEK